MSKRRKCVCGKESPLSEQRCPYCRRPLSMYGKYVTDEYEPDIPYKPYDDEDSKKPPVDVKESSVKQKKTKEKAPERREGKEKKRGGAGKTVLVIFLLLIILLLGAIVVLLLLDKEPESGSVTTQPPVVQTTPVDTAPDTTAPADTQPVQTDPPATNPPATQPPATDPPATESPTTEPPVEDGPWMNNVLSADFKVVDYSLCSHIGYTSSDYDPAVHVIFVDNLKGLQNTSTHWIGSARNKKLVRAAWDVSEAQDGSVWAWYSIGHLGDVDSCDYRCNSVLYIGAEGGVNASLACAEMFAGCTDLKYIDFRGCFYTVGATSMEKMFYNCSSLREVDVTCFNTANVTNMSNMFYGIKASCNIIMDLNRFNTCNVTEYDNFMYYGDEINGVPWTDLFP